METYIDISFIFNIILSLTSIKFMKIISNNKMSKKASAFLVSTNIILYLNIFIFTSYALSFNSLYYLIIFIIIYRKNFLLPLFTYLFSYYSLLSLIRIFTSNIYLYKGSPMIYKPNAFFYVLLLPVFIIIVQLITRSIKSLILLKKYRYRVTLNIKDEVYHISAYFDSGNTLKFNNLPVVFLTSEYLINKDDCKEMLIKGIGDKVGKYEKGKIIFDNKQKDVYCAFVNKRSFNGCKCLLNVYLLG